MPYLGTKHQTADRDARRQADALATGVGTGGDVAAAVELGMYVDLAIEAGESMDALESEFGMPVPNLRAAHRVYQASMAGRLIGVDDLALAVSIAGGAA